MKQAKANLPNLTQTEAVYGKANEDSKLSQQDFTALMQQVEKESKKINSH